MPRVEFHFDFGSPNAYLSHRVIPAIESRTGATFLYVPVLLGGVFKATGNASPITIPAKGKWLFRDLERYAEFYGVPFRLNPHFPINTLTLMRGAASYQLEGDFDRYVTLMFRAMWEHGEPLGEEAGLRRVLSAGGFDADDFAARVTRPEVKQALIANTDEAVARGAFGAPTFFVGEDMLFGQDHLPMVEWLLQGKPAGPPKAAP